MNKSRPAPSISALLQPNRVPDPLHREKPTPPRAAGGGLLLSTTVLSLSSWEPPWRRRFDTAPQEPMRRESQPPITPAPGRPLVSGSVLAPASTDRPRAPAREAAGSPRRADPPQQPMHRESARGPLRNGNPRGNPNLAPRCGAKTRAGCPCKGPAMRNGRCRMHGGASTGPRTAEGRARLAAARTIHGAYGAQARARRAHIVTFTARSRVLDAVVKTGLPMEALAPMLHVVHPPAAATMRRNRGRSPYAVNPLALMELPLTAGQGRDLVRMIRAAVAPPGSASVDAVRHDPVRREREGGWPIGGPRRRRPEGRDLTSGPSVR